METISNFQIWFTQQTSWWWWYWLSRCILFFSQREKKKFDTLLTLFYLCMPYTFCTIDLIEHKSIDKNVKHITATFGTRHHYHHQILSMAKGFCRLKIIFLFFPPLLSLSIQLIIDLFGFCYKWEKSTKFGQEEQKTQQQWPVAIASFSIVGCYSEIK